MFNSATINNQGEMRATVYYTGSDTLREGHALCYDWDSSQDGSTAGTDDARVYHAEKPSLNNIKWFAGVVAPGQTRVGAGYVQIIRPAAITGGVMVYTDQSVTAGDYLGPMPGSYAFGPALFGVPPVFRAIETVDRSTTAGLAMGEFGNLPIDAATFDQQYAVMFDDFFSFTTAHKGWAVTADAGSTGGQAAIAGSLVGEAAIYSDGDDEDEAYATHNMAVSAAKPFYMRVRAKISEAGTDDTNAYIGVTDDVVASGNVMADSGGGPQASGDHACFFKVDGGTVWQAETSASSTQETNTNVGTRDTSYHIYEIINKVTSVEFYIDGTLVHTSSTTIPTGVDLRPVFGAKAGGAAEENITVDYILLAQKR